MRNDLSHESRVWLYQAERDLTADEQAFLLAELQDFCKSWTAHDQSLKADCNILYNRFILLTVDETQTDASGCSIDKSVKKLKELSFELQIDFFNRLNIAYLNQEKVDTIPMNELSTAIKNGAITESTLLFNTLVKDLGEMQDSFLQPLKQHWINKTI